VDGGRGIDAVAIQCAHMYASCLSLVDACVGVLLHPRAHARSVEVAKNVALGGVKALAIWDPAPTTSLDLAAQYYLTPDDIGKPRAEVTRFV
jgi:molybdopterin/thiamine biosynthesis adenylyltransferase